MMTLYVIRNCDTCRRALRALDDRGSAYRLHDLREGGLSEALLEYILHRVPVMEALNRRSTTWRQLGEEEKAGIDANSARRLILSHPTLLKRPLLDTGEEIRVGYRDGDYDDIPG